MPTLNRRSFIAASALSAGAAMLPRTGLATGPLARAQGPGVYRYKLGADEITALYDGIWYFPIDGKFIRNASGAQVNQALTTAFLPPITITALMVNTGSKLILIDTGSAGQITDTAGFMNANLASAGVKPADIDIILISHFHPDHIDGIKPKTATKFFRTCRFSYRSRNGSSGWMTAMKRVPPGRCW